MILPVVLYWCGTGLSCEEGTDWGCVRTGLSGEQKEDGTRGWIKFHEKELYNLCTKYAKMMT
jgi:hypothetical protein